MFPYILVHAYYMLYTIPYILLIIILSIVCIILLLILICVASNNVISIKIKNIDKICLCVTCTVLL